MGKTRVENLMWAFNITREPAVKIDKMMTAARKIGSQKRSGRLSYEQAKKVLEEIRDELAPVSKKIGYSDDIQDTAGRVIYINTGDTYSMTVLYYYESNTFYVQSWGDFVETKQRSHGANYFDPYRL